MPPGDPTRGVRVNPEDRQGSWTWGEALRLEGRQESQAHLGLTKAAEAGRGWTGRGWTGRGWTGPRKQTGSSAQDPRSSKATRSGTRGREWGPAVMTASPVGVTLPVVGACGSGHGRSRWSGDTGPARAAPSGTRPRGPSRGWPSTVAVG